MTNSAHNSDELLLLISRGLDGDLSPAERRRLDEALSQSEALRLEASRIEAVDRLIGRWGQSPVELDWKSHAALTSAIAVEGTDDTGSRKINALLRRWSRRSAEVEAIDLTAGVLAKIRAERRRSAPYRLVLRLGVPLAAAAAIILALTVTTWFGSSPQQICEVAMGPRARTRMVDSAVPSSLVVWFARPSEAAASPRAASIGFMTIGVEPTGVGSEEGAPL